ncbi:MAG: hypothetical protein ACPHGX_03730, partial [Ilumatobacteraceae bacterium]
GVIRSLSTNWRSDPAMLTAIETILSGEEFGAPDVLFEPVEPADRPDRAVFDDGRFAPVELRPVPGGTVPEAEPVVLDDLTAEVLRLLEIGRLTDHEGEGGLRPSDIGIITKSNSDAAKVAMALRAVGVPVVTSTRDSVMTSSAAFHWRTLLESLDRPNAVHASRAVALGHFGSLSVGDLTDLSDADELALLDEAAARRDALESGGVPRLLAQLRATVSASSPPSVESASSPTSSTSASSSSGRRPAPGAARGGSSTSLSAGRGIPTTNSAPNSSNVASIVTMTPSRCSRSSRRRGSSSQSCCVHSCGART